MAKKIGKRTVVVVRQARVDRLKGDAAGPPDEHDIDGCAVVPRSSNEQGKGWITVEGWMVIAPYGADVLSTDQVRYDGKLWDVEGDPGDYETKRARGKATIFYLARLGSGTA